MRPTTLAAAVLLALFGLFASGCDDSEQEVRDTFAEYSAARSGRDPTKAIKFIDPRYFEHLDYVVKMARSGDRDKIMRMTIPERIDVVMIRNRLTKAEIAALDGRSWLERMYKEGWAIDELVGALDIGKIKVKKPRAYASMEILGIETDVTMEFVKVGDQWVMDLTALEELINKEMKKSLSSLEAENHQILEAERMGSGHPVRAVIWDTPK